MDMPRYGLPSQIQFSAVADSSAHEPGRVRRHEDVRDRVGVGGHRRARD